MIVAPLPPPIRPKDPKPEAAARWTFLGELRLPATNLPGRRWLRVDESALVCSALSHDQENGWRYHLSMSIPNRATTQIPDELKKSVLEDFGMAEAVERKAIMSIASAVLHFFLPWKPTPPKAAA